MFNFQLLVNSIVYADVADLTFTLLNQLAIIIYTSVYFVYHSLW